jgi:hypothetical protein
LFVGETVCDDRLSNVVPIAAFNTVLLTFARAGELSSI